MANVTISGGVRSGLLALPWLFGPRADLAVSLGGMLAGFALVGMHLFLGWNMILVWFIWVVTLDTPHFFATYARTYLDKQARQTFRPLLSRSLVIFLIAPVAILLSRGFFEMGVADYRAPWRLFIYGVSLWAYYHITRQHYGVLRLYNRKNGETGSEEARLDSLVLYGYLAVSFLGVLTYYPRTQRIFGLGGVELPGTFLGMPFGALSLANLNDLVFGLALLAALSLAALFFAFQIGKLLRGEPVNLPKVVFLSSVLLLHGVVSFGGVLPAESTLPFTAVITIYHDIQYLFIVWFHGKNRYGTTAESRRAFGIAGYLSKSFPRFMAAALLTMSLPIWTFGCAIGRVQVCPGPDWGQATFLGETTWILFFAAVTAGFQMHHYVLDQYIWRPSRSAKLREELRLESAAAR